MQIKKTDWKTNLIVLVGIGVMCWFLALFYQSQSTTITYELNCRESTAIRRAYAICGRDAPDFCVLGVDFHGNPVHYRYDNVPFSVFERWQEAKSKGRFYNNFIRGKFKRFD